MGAIRIKNRLNGTQINEILEIYKNQTDVKVEDIAKTYGISAAAIFDLAKKNGLHRNKHKRPRTRTPDGEHIKTVTNSAEKFTVMIVSSKGHLKIGNVLTIKELMKQLFDLL